MFVEKVRDVVGLYLDPPVKAMLLCVDEKSQMQALERTRPRMPMMPTVPARQTHGYVRHGVASLFAASIQLRARSSGNRTAGTAIRSS